MTVAKPTSDRNGDCDSWINSARSVLGLGGGPSTSPFRGLPCVRRAAIPPD